MSFAGRSLAAKDGESNGRSVLTRLVDRALPALPAGHLQLTLPNGEIVERRGDHDGPDAAMVVHRWRAFGRMMLDGEHGFADSYLDGDWSTPDLAPLLEYCVCNESGLTTKAANGRFGLLRNKLTHWLRSNSRRGSKRNIAAHYDLGNEFFKP
jgi:cyclopropane-fatty-acyl-phospholipid synthase